MSEILAWLVSYPGVLAACFLCGLAIPLPEDVPQVLVGTQVAAGRLEWLPAIAAASVGVFARDALFFGLGHALGERVLTHPWVGWVVSPQRIEVARARVRDHGALAVVLGRFSIGFRTSTFLVAGALGVRPRDFVVGDAVALVASVPLLLGVGYAFGAPAADAVLWVRDQVGWAAPLAAGALVLGAWGWSRRTGPVDVDPGDAAT